MRTHIIGFGLALSLLASCATLPVRDFAGDYQRASGRRHVIVAGYAPFNIVELRAQRRLKVQLNVLAHAFGWVGNPLILLGITDGIPPAAAHQEAARTYLVETGRPSCSIIDAAVSPSGREFEFRYHCPGA
jgi:hypothetical protein